jgi:4,5-DOPA dioxygenase extradiol
VLILCSGNIVHNLGLFAYRNPAPLDWAVRFDANVKQRIINHDHEALITHDRLGTDAKLAVPTPEHYLPLLYALALQEENEPVSFFNNAVMGSISMTSVVIGMA